MRMRFADFQRQYPTVTEFPFRIRISRGYVIDEHQAYDPRYIDLPLPLQPGTHDEVTVRDCGFQITTEPLQFTDHFAVTAFIDAMILALDAYGRAESISDFRERLIMGPPEENRGTDPKV